MIMMLITFALFWFTYRYQMIYVSYAKTETNGLIFPKAINQLFTGVYFLELCLIGLFFLQDGPNKSKPCIPQAIIMIVVLAFTIMFQVLVNRAFSPLFQYLPITFEDEAVERDQEFQAAQARRWEQQADDEHQPLNSELQTKEAEEPRENQLLGPQETRDIEMSKPENTQSYEMKKLESGNSRPARPQLGVVGTHSSSFQRTQKSNWADRSRSRSRSRSYQKSTHHNPRQQKSKVLNPFDRFNTILKTGLNDVARPVRDMEAQILPGANLFDDINDALEDIEPEARQKLIKRSFQHPATRAIQPAIWIPQDELGVARDEIMRTGWLSDRIWITSVNAILDARGKVMYKGLPPDRDPFDNIEV
jgi:hypothetical protein